MSVTLMKSLATTLFVSLFLICSIGNAEPHRDSRVSVRLAEQLESDGRVRVLVAFEVPDLERSQSEQSVSPDTRLSRQAATIRTARSNVMASLSNENYSLEREFNYINGVALTVNAAGLDELLSSDAVVSVDLDEGGQGHLMEGLPLANIDAVQSMGFTGKGVTVAVLDTGIDSDHPDLSDSLVAEACFCSDSGNGCCPAGGTTQLGVGSAEDDNGHGTHVSGIITSNGIVGPLGSAPDAKIVAVKVIDENNVFCCSSDIVAGLDWLIGRDDIDLINMSLGTFARFAGQCDSAQSFLIPMATAINTLKSQGVTAFASAGNNADNAQMGAPACIENVVAVGSVNDFDESAGEISSFSNSNSETDVFAPGALITSSALGGGTVVFQGTSMASPMTAGCAALLLEADPALSPATLKNAITTSSTELLDTRNDLTFPLLDCVSAKQAIESSCFIIQASNGNIGTICL